METRANYVLVGVFTVVVLALSFGFVWWSANVSDQDSRVQMLVRIEGSVTGLSVGSQVLFNGLRVGDVRNLRIDPNDPRIVIASTQVDATTPITTSTVATIGFAGLTGQAFIELKGGNVNERNIIAYAREQGAVPVIRADPSDVTDILATARDIADRADNILSQFEGMVGDVGPAVRTTAANVSATSENIKVFTDSLAANSGQIDEFLQSVSRLAVTANTVAEALPDAIRSVQDIVEAVDPAAVRTTVDNVAAMSGTLRAQSDNVASVVESVRTAANSVGTIGETIQRNTPGIDRFLSNLGPISDTATSVATRLDSALGSADEILAAVDPAVVNATLRDISSAANTVSDVSTMVGEQREEITEVLQNVTGITRNLRNVTNGFSENRETIDRFIANLGPISDNASEASTKLNRTLDDAGRLVSGIDRQRISETVDNVAGIVAGLNAKTPQIQSVIDGADRTLRTVDTALTGIDGTRQRVDAILAGIDPETVNRAVTNVSSATDNVARAADSIASIANDIGARREDINRIITNAEQTSAKVNTASTRLDTVLASLDRLLNASSTEGLAAEASATLAAIRETATSINARVGPIAANIQAFSGNGLSEVRTLVRDVTRSVNRIEGAVTDFQADPSRIIFGGDEVKQFDGRTRR
ncbi:MAG: MCE family protein [Rhizobiaceae bacterium]|nr:MCE family protein [Rhizobiaceae bacterium]